MSNISISRDYSLINKVVLVDGQPGCGKTMLSPIISSLQKVELVSYIFEMEFICRLFNLKKISKDASLAMIKMLIDHKIYQTMMGRETNFRHNDISSIFQYRNPQQYFKRIFDIGDEAIPDKIIKEKPVLNIATLNLLINSDLLFEALGKKLVLIEVVRHPLYMLIQQTLNMERLINNPRDIDVYYKKNKIQYPYFAYGWEKKFNKFNSTEKAIYSIFLSTYNNNKKRIKIFSRYNNNFMSIPFEHFVLKPDNYLKKIKKLIGVNFSKDSKRILREQKIPRKKITDSISLDVYKRCGWNAPKEDLSENEELKLIRDFAIKNNVSKEMLELLDKLSSQYEQKYYNNLNIR